MKNLDLNKFGVQEMNENEMKTVEGGGFFAMLIGAVVGAAIGSIWGEEKNGAEIGAICGALLPI